MSVTSACSVSRRPGTTHEVFSLSYISLSNFVLIRYTVLKIRDLIFLQNWLEMPIYGTGKARNFKFGICIDLGKSHFIDDKMSPKGAC